MSRIVPLLTAGLILPAISHGVAVVLVMIEHRSAHPQGPRAALLCLGTGALVRVQAPVVGWNDWRKGGRWPITNP